MASNDDDDDDNDKFNELTSPLLPRGEGEDGDGDDDNDVEEDLPAAAANAQTIPPTAAFTLDTHPCNHDDVVCVECDTSVSKYFTNFCENLFQSHSGHATPIRKQNSSSIMAAATSKFSVEGICCASEIPIIKSILRKRDGISKVVVNPSARTVFVDHDVDIVSAEEIAKMLSDKSFPATVMRDGAEEVTGEQEVPMGIPKDVFVQSAFDMSKIDVGEVDLLSKVRSCLDAKFSQDNMKVNKNHILQVSGFVFVIEHNPYYVTSSGIADLLGEHFEQAGSVTVLDGGKDKDGMWAMMRGAATSRDKHGNDEHPNRPNARTTVHWTVVLSGLLWFVSLLSYIGGKAEYLKYVALVSVALALPPIARKAFQMLRRLHFDINCMVLTAALGALALQDYTEAAAVSFLFSISSTLESLANARARNALGELVNVRTENARVWNENTGEGVVLKAEEVVVGSVLMVGEGETIPCDGIIIEGSSTIDESKLNGENKPATKVPGSPVSSGTVNAGSTQLLIKTTATSKNSAVARRGQLIEEAQSSSSDTETLINTFARIYTPIVALMALSMCTIPWAFGNEVGRYWAKNGLITIAIACPCAFVISTPVTHMAALAAAARKGVLIKGGLALEGLGRVGSVAFDKTGTLTQGTFKLLHFDVVGKTTTRSRKEVLGYLALMETQSSHPLADAIVKAATNEGVDVPKLNMQNHKILPGEGITADIENKVVHVGNKKLFQRLGIYVQLPQDVKIKTEKWAQSGGTIGFASIEGEGIVGAYCVADEIRSEAKEVVEALKKVGINITMLTGDAHPAAISIGQQLGLEEDDIKSDLHPKEKMKVIAGKIEEDRQKKKCWNKKRAVMMVGDGVNDAPALSVADVSVAMGEGAALAIDTADITLMDSNLHKLDWIVTDLGKRVIWTIIENVTFSLLVKLIVVGFAITGRASLWAAVLSDVGTLIAVTLNGSKLISSSPTEKEKDKNNDEA